MFATKFTYFINLIKKIYKIESCFIVTDYSFAVKCYKYGL